MQTGEIKDKRRQMMEEFEDLIQELEVFENKPTKIQKNILKSKFSQFNYAKNRLASKVRDFLC